MTCPLAAPLRRPADALIPALPSIAFGPSTGFAARVLDLYAALRIARGMGDAIAGTIRMNVLEGTGRGRRAGRPRAST
jgi:hypothetical protein